MILQEEYHFQPSDFDSNGFHKTTSQLFSDFIRDCEIKFHDQHQPFFANAFSANVKTLRLLKSCYNSEENEIFGMETVSGDVDIDMNLKIEEKGDSKTVYAIGRFKDDDEPLYLISDSNVSDSEFVLKYLSDDDEKVFPDISRDPHSKKKIFILA